MVPQVIIDDGLDRHVQQTFLVLHEDEYVTSYGADREIPIEHVVEDVFYYCNGSGGEEFQGKDLAIWRGDGRLSAVIRRGDDGRYQVTRFL
jgi:hypothetical protein